MIEVTDFLFQILGNLWTLILGNWILSISILIILLNWVITLVNGSRQNN